MAEKAIQATTLNEADVRRFIAELASTRSDKNLETRFGKLHKKIRQREDHFYNLPGADQKLPPPHDTADAYQSDIARRTHVEFKSRMTENPLRVKVTPARSTVSQKAIANNMATVFDRGLELVQERAGFSIQGDLADGQMICCYGVLHWQKAADVWPSFPEALKEAEEPDEEERKNFEERDGVWIETDRSRIDRHDHGKARAGFPWYIEVPHPSMFSFIRDRSVDNGMAMALLLREVPLIEYNDKLRMADEITVSIHDVEPRLRIHREAEGPAQGEPSAQSNPTTVHVAQLWTRDEMYEAVARSGADGSNSGAWQLVKSFKHAYGMPPFALATGNYTNHPDVSLAYEPLLEGVYRNKPFHDKVRTLVAVLSEEIALPFYYLKLADGQYMTGGDGKPKALTRSAASALQIPGELVKVDFDLDPAMIQNLELHLQELQESAPRTGNVEVGASTQPWTVRLAQDIANAEVKNAKFQQALAVRTMIRSMARVQSLPAGEGGFGEAVLVYARETDGRINRDQTVGVAPEDIISLDIDVTIDPNSSAQTIANIEHAIQWLNDPLVPYTQMDFMEEAFRAERPLERIKAAEAELIYRERVRTGVVEQMLVERFGKTFVASPDGTIVGPGGQPTQPGDVLAANGFRILGAGPSAGPTGDVLAESTPIESRMAPLQTPGV